MVLILLENFQFLPGFVHAGAAGSGHPYGLNAAIAGVAGCCGNKNFLPKKTAKRHRGVCFERVNTAVSAEAGDPSASGVRCQWPVSTVRFCRYTGLPGRGPRGTLRGHFKPYAFTGTVGHGRRRRSRPGIASCRTGRSCRGGRLFAVIRMVVEDGVGAVKLFGQQDAHHAVWQGHGR